MSVFYLQQNIVHTYVLPKQIEYKIHFAVVS